MPDRLQCLDGLGPYVMSVVRKVSGAEHLTSIARRIARTVRVRCRRQNASVSEAPRDACAHGPDANDAVAAFQRQLDARIAEYGESAAYRNPHTTTEIHDSQIVPYGSGKRIIDGWSRHAAADSGEGGSFLR